MNSWHSVSNSASATGSSYNFSGSPTSIVLKTNGTPTTTRTFTWDKESRITALTDGTTSASYVYNGFTARTSKTVGGTTTTYKRAGASAVSPVVADAVGGTTTNHLPGISSRSGGTSTFSHSGIKNGVLQTNSSQTNTGTKRYDAFGNVLATTGSWTTPFSYGTSFGYQSDSEFGYQLLGHRYFDPSTGRFLTRDPVADGRNWYAYCNNSPVDSADYDGLQKQTIVWGNDEGLGWWSPIGFNLTMPYVNSSDILLNWPTKKRLMTELLDADEFYFFGHSSRDGHLKLNKTEFLNMDDIEKLNRLRKRYGKGKLKYVELRGCHTVATKKAVNTWLDAAEKVAGYKRRTVEEFIEPLVSFTKKVDKDPNPHISNKKKHL